MRISNFSSMCHFFVISRGRARQLHLICYRFRKLHDVAENWVLMFELLVGGNLHIFEILVFQIVFLGGYCRAERFYLIEFKMDSLSLSPSNEITRQLLTFLL